jgi:hypothetical protein
MTPPTPLDGVRPSICGITFACYSFIARLMTAVGASGFRPLLWQVVQQHCPLTTRVISHCSSTRKLWRPFRSPAGQAHDDIERRAENVLIMHLCLAIRTTDADFVAVLEGREHGAEIGGLKKTLLIHTTMLGLGLAIAKAFSRRADSRSTHIRPPEIEMIVKCRFSVLYGGQKKFQLYVKGDGTASIPVVNFCGGCPPEPSNGA